MTATIFDNVSVVWKRVAQFVVLRKKSLKNDLNYVDLMV